LGTSEFYITGSLRDWSTLKTVHYINVPTFLINGKYDEAQDIAPAPFFWAIAKVKWVTLAGSAHLPHLDEPETFLELVREFLTL
jgi:L-proline amide hydrolase